MLPRFSKPTAPTGRLRLLREEVDEEEFFDNDDVEKGLGNDFLDGLAADLREEDDAEDGKFLDVLVVLAADFTTVLDANLEFGSLQAEAVAFTVADILVV